MSALKQIKERLSGLKGLETQTELNLAGIKITRFTEDVKKYLEKLKKVQILIIPDCGLQTLDNLPAWKLAAVDLSRNQFDDSVLAKLITIPTLTQIILLGNKVENVESLKQLSALKELNEVDFTQNPVASKADYRSTLFDSISTLEVVDQKDKDGNDWVEEPEEGSDGDEYDEDEDDEEFQGDDDDEEEYEEESSDKPKKKRK